MVSAARGRGAGGWGGAHLEGAEEEVEEELDEAQGAVGLLVRHKGEHHFVDPQQGDEGQRGLGQPVGAGPEHGPWASPAHPPPAARTHRSL